MVDDIVDVCVDERRCLIARFRGLATGSLDAFTDGPPVSFTVTVRPVASGFHTSRSRS